MPTTVLFLFAPRYHNPPWAVCEDIICGVDRSVIRPLVVNDSEAEDPELSGTPGVAVERLPLHSAADRVRRGDPRGTAELLGSLARLARMVRRERVDVIHVNNDVLSCVFGVAVAALTRVKLVVQHHARPDDSGGSPRRAARNACLRFAANRADCNLACSRFVSDELQRAWKIDASKIAIVLNGVDTVRFHPGVDGRPMRREYGIRDDELLVVQVARLQKQKRQEDLVRAMAVARKRVRNLRCLIVGWDDPRYDGSFPSYRAELDHLRNEAKLGDALILATARPEAPQLHAAADIACLPSTGEAFGLVVAEAMACGRPVIGAHSGGLSELIVDGESGLLSPHADVAGLAERLVRLASDPALRERMGEAARRRAVELFSLQRLGNEAAAVYEATARGTPRSKPPAV